MAAISIQRHRLVRAEEAFSSMPERYLGAEEDYSAVVQIKLGDVGRTWEVELSPKRCKVRTSPCREPDVIIGTDAGTWLALREGRLSGLDAFAQRRLWAPRGPRGGAVGRGPSPPPRGPPPPPGRCPPRVGGA